MRVPLRFLTHAAMFVTLIVAGSWLWLAHARAWDLGRRSPVLSYDAAQYAVAARELALRGRFATIYALPVELARHPTPPWPLALVQPGMVISEALLLRLTPFRTRVAEGHTWDILRPDQLEWLVLVVPFVSFLLIAVGFGLATSHVLRRYAKAIPVVIRALAGTVLGLAFLLDPESQHFAVGGFTELPFTLGLAGATAALALGIAPRLPLAFGVLLGVTGAFRGTMLWLAPILALGNAAALSPDRATGTEPGSGRGQRARVFALTLLGFALPLLPWWIYKWHSFGHPGWDLSALSVWDGVQGRNWFSLFHAAELPPLPRGADAALLLMRKTARNLPGVALSLAGGVRPLLGGALVLWLVALRDSPRTLRVAALTLIGMAVVNLIATAASVPQLRYLFPIRVVCDAAGALALWGLVARAPMLSAPVRRLVAVLCAAVVLAWGVRITRAGNAEARATAMERGTPGALSLLRIAAMMQREIPSGEPVMSNLGPELAWEARRPVIHLALSPDQLNACRRSADFRHVLLVFRDAQHAWPEWTGVVAHPLDALHQTEWNVRQVRRYDTADGFMLIWLELGPLSPPLAIAR
jgi:hypothetical protein